MGVNPPKQGCFGYHSRVPEIPPRGAWSASGARSSHASASDGGFPMPWHGRSSSGAHRVIGSGHRSGGSEENLGGGNGPYVNFQIKGKEHIY